MNNYEFLLTHPHPCWRLPLPKADFSGGLWADSQPCWMLWRAIQINSAKSLGKARCCSSWRSWLGNAFPHKGTHQPHPHTQSSDHSDARLKLISASAEMKGAAASKPCWAPFGEIQTGNLDFIATGNKLVTSPACQAMQQLMDAPITSLLGYSSRVLCSLLRFLSGNSHSTSLTQSQCRVLEKINYTPGLPLTGNNSWVANVSFNLKKTFRCCRVVGQTEESLENLPWHSFASAITTTIFLHIIYAPRASEILSFPLAELLAASHCSDYFTSSTLRLNSTV